MVNGCGEQEQSSGVQVSCRLRGVSTTEQAAGCRNTIYIDPSDRRCIIVPASPPLHTFRFDHVFSPTSTQEEVFSSIGQTCVDELLQGYNCTLLAYGQTGSGKTYTTMGTSDDNGLVPRMLDQLFAAVEHDPEATLTANFIEVYQERLHDLLASGSTSSIRIREDKAIGDVWVDGASEITLLNLATAIATLHRGLAYRSVGSTQLNRESSRSHAVFAVTLTRTTVLGDRVRARLCVVDLAGSEQAKKTGTSGKRLEEAKYINRSLSALGNVVYALTNTSTSQPYVPYRDSKLTRLLQASLGGNTKTHLLLTCATANCHLEESLSTMRFGARATRMQNKPVVNVHSTGTREDQQHALLETLQHKVESLCRYIHELETAAANPSCRCRSKMTSQAETVEMSADLPDDTTELEEDEGTAPATTNTLLSSDLIVQAELLTLRKALDDMHRLHQHEELHAQSLQSTIDSVEHREIEKLHHQQAREIARLNAQLSAAEREIAALQWEQREQRKRDVELQRQLRHLVSQQQRNDDAVSAETEILRRQLGHTEKQLKSVHLELAASRAEAVALLQQVEVGERERFQMRDELNSVQLQLHITPASPLPVSVSSTSPPRGNPMLRPVTVAGERSGTSSAAIQSWWSGGLGNNYEEEGNVREQQSTVVPRLSELNVATRTRCSTSITGARRRLESLEETSPLVRTETEAVEDVDVIRNQLLHTSGGARPFRARLVGLLNTLEAETASYKELLSGATEGRESLVVARPLPAHARSPMRRHRLPELSTAPDLPSHGKGDISVVHFKCK